ncbi:MAG: hypothetical protein K2Y16_11265 [Burkholderiales bacterium]|nr:hypothetical protein [Burkholderiales bacterium]PZR42966.1 MAG: hypothetical protein DI537_62335 [Stutzerimonas stutzeri]
MIAKRWSRVAVWIALLALGFTQMVSAAQPCMQPVMTVSDAFVTASEDSCHHSDSANAGLCLKQCIGGDRLSSTILPVVAPPPMMPVLILPLPTDGARSRVVAAARAGLVVDPPIPIRFCSFLI